MPLDRGIINEVLSRYPAACRGEPVAAPAPRGFSGALIFRVRAAAGEFCLRGWPGDPPPLARIRGLHRLQTFVHEAGVTQIPVAVPDENGETLVCLHGRYWQVETWRPGIADFHQQPTAARLANAMAVLADFHRAAARFGPTSCERPWFASAAAAPSPAVAERLERLRGWQREQLDRVRQRLGTEADNEFRRLALEIIDNARRLGRSIAAQLASAAQLRVRLGPCLRDVWHDHLLFTGDKVTGLVDLAACRSESAAADLSRLLGSLVGDDPQRWDLALAAYQRHRPLSLDELGLIPVLDRSGVLLSGLTWLERRYLREDASVESSRVVERLRSIAGRLWRMAPQ